MATTMPSLPAGNPPSGKSGFSTALMIGSSVFGGGSALYIVVQLIRQEPERAFNLLNKWGPGYLLALFIAYVVDKVLNKAMDGTQRATDRSAEAIREVAIQMQSIAEATSRQAEAVQAAASKNDSVTQEMQILIGVVNAKVEQALDEQKRGNRALERIENALKINLPAESEKA